MTAIGLFEPWLNGQRVGCDFLLPGWTDYSQRIETMAYDVTALVRTGMNRWGAWLGDGWACGRLGFQGRRNFYSAEPALLGVLRLEAEDGSVCWIGTGADWTGWDSPIRSADLYDGECYDARREDPSWCQAGPGYSSGWQPVQLRKERVTAELLGKSSEPVRTVAELSAQSVIQSNTGVWIFDLGQNIAGVVRLRVQAKRGTRLTLRHGEMLRPDGSLYIENLRSARCTDTYICRGGETEIWNPRFTFHGFRYVEISGLKTRPQRDAVTGLVWSSDLADTGGFACSQPLINRLQSNIRWGQIGNFLDVPTDCPQRDERLGWTGDAQVFTPTALFNFAAVPFLRKYCADLRDAQSKDGAFPDVAPDVFAIEARREGRDSVGGNAAWADAGVIIPWALYAETGDKTHLEENFSAMCRWVEYQERTAVNGLRPDTAYGDWVATEAVRADWAPTPSDLIGTAYFARSTVLTARAAEVLGEKRVGKKFRRLHGKILAAFRRGYVAPSGRLVGDTQTAYALALAFDLLPPPMRPAAVRYLLRSIERRGYHLSTGFVGTPLICPVLTAHGQHDLAARLLLNEDYPSWLMPVKNGATTMWERWNSWTPEDGFGPVGMNSFNHYAFGAVGEWLYRDVAGLGQLGVGWKHLHFVPRPAPGLDHAEAWHETPEGRAECGWRRYARGGCDFEFLVPPNSTATATLTVASAGVKMIKPKHAAAARLLEIEPGVVRVEDIGPGRWRFRARGTGY